MRPEAPNKSSGVFMPKLSLIMVIVGVFFLSDLGVRNHGTGVHTDLEKQEVVRVFERGLTIIGDPNAN